jgi:hypothetical protein
MEEEGEMDAATALGDFLDVIAMGKAMVVKS